MNLTSVHGQKWRLQNGVGIDLIDDVTNHVRRNTERSVGHDAGFARQPRKTQQQAIASVPRAVEETFDAVAGVLLRGDRYALHPKCERRIQREVERRIVRNPWYLPFGGRLLKLAIRTAVTLALGYLRSQFPVIGSGELVQVAGVLQNAVDRKPIR